MKKIICDFCKKETEHSTEYKLPHAKTICYGSLDGTTMDEERRYNDKMRDVCPECQKKIAELLELVPKIKNEGDNSDIIRIIGEWKR